MMRRLLKPLWILLALIFLFEAWLWNHLEPIVARIVDLIPWRALKARVAAAIEHLPPTATLIVFVVPAALLFPIKLAGLWLLAHGQLIAAVGTLVLAKLVGLGVTAFVFDVTRHKLLQLAWFRWLYERVLWMRDWAHGLVDPIKRRLKRFFRLFAPHRAGRTLRLMWRIRRRMLTARGTPTQPIVGA